MTAASLLRDLTAFSLQIALVALGVAVLLKLVRIPAGARYLGLRLALVLSLVAPWLLRAPEVQAPALATGDAQVMAIASVPASGGPSEPAPRAAAAQPSRSVAAIPWMEVGFGALLIGIVARVVWLGMGVLRLLRMKRSGVVVDAPEYSELQQRLGTRATIAQVEALSQPATFGVRRPMVLLPDALAAAPGAVRRAVVTHELFHVQRRDWLAVLAEEIIRTALWFHPAVHWMTAQIQLAREEIVDELTVGATGDRRTYVEALLAFADTPGLSPAPAFAHRRQLFHRILSVSKEKVMSRPRIVSSTVVLIAAVSGASWYASTLFPIVKAAKADVTLPSTGQVLAQSGSGVEGAGRQLSIEELRREIVELRTAEATLRAASAAVVLLDQQTGEVLAVRPVTPENPIPRRARGVAPVAPSQYPSAQVVVSTRVTVDRNGAVTAVEPDSCAASDGRNGNAAVCAGFQNAAAAAIRQWRYERPAQAPIQFYVKVTFRPGSEAAIAQSGESYLRETQANLRTFAEMERANATNQSAVASLQSRVIEMSRELERAQRLTERGLPAGDSATLQADIARLNAEIARADAQIRSERAGDERARAAAEQARQQLSEAHRRLEESRAQQTLEKQARTEEELRAVTQQLNDLARQFEVVRSPQANDEITRLAEAARRAQGQLEAGGRQPDQATTATVSSTPTTPFDGGRQLKSPSGRAPIRVTPPMKPPVPVKTATPQYSAEAMQARLQGTVAVEVLVDEKGHVADARVLRSVPLLDGSALDAAKQWEFTPTLMNGEPVPVLLQLEMHFTLK